MNIIEDTLNHLDFKTIFPIKLVIIIKSKSTSEFNDELK